MAGAGHARTDYALIYGWLVGLLLVSLLAVYLPFSQPVTVTIIFLVAAAKAALVAAYFMHLRFERRLIYAMVLTPLTLFVIMTLTLIPDIVLNR
ncbi:MAG: cytochrome C oxidase subunit IV family protein [Acidobacteriota bacterium]